MYFFDRADRGGGGATDEKRIPRRRWKEGNAVGFSRSSRQPLRRPFYIHSSPPVVVFASRFMDKNRSSKPARNRKLHVYIYIYNETRHRLPQRISRHRSSVIITRYALPFWSLAGSFERRGKVRKRRRGKRRGDRVSPCFASGIRVIQRAFVETANNRASFEFKIR